MKHLFSDWNYSEALNRIHHECEQYPKSEWEWAGNATGKWVCTRCNEVAPQEVQDICLFLKPRTWDARPSLSLQYHDIIE